MSGEKNGNPGSEWIPAGEQVTGTVEYINREGHFYRVRYEVFGSVQHECFPIPVPKEPKEYERETLHNGPRKQSTEDKGRYTPKKYRNKK